jgi:hypothetical protein
MPRTCAVRNFLSVVCHPLGYSLVSVIQVPAFRNTVSIFVGEEVGSTHSPMKMEQTECYETLALKLRTPVNNPEESI